jgi:AraC-like DNA-binding protein
MFSPSVLPPPAAPPVAPALEALLGQATLRVDIVAEERLCGSWYMDEPRYHCGLFHLVGAGRCQVESTALDQALALEAGDLVVFPHGDAHRLCAGAPPSPQPTSLICGELHFSPCAQHALSQALPACFTVRARHASPTFRQLAAMMVEVSGAGLAGRQVLLNKLADSLFTLAICDYASRDTERRGLFAALADSRICRVLQAIHQAPGEGWTMQSMAALACMSRSAFAERFTQLVRMPPMQYVTHWRVGVAEKLLRERQLSVAAIAERLGYGSEAAFRRLYKRVSGVGPGSVRASAAIGAAA